MHARFRAPLTALTFFWAATASAATGDHVWSRGDDAAAYADVDAAGNAVLAGTFFGTIDFGGGPLTSGGLFNPDVFIASLDATGAHRWSASFTPVGPADFTQVDAVAASPSGELYIGGRIQVGSIDFGGGPIGTGGDLFVAKFDAAGTHVWSTTFGSGNVYDLHATDSHVAIAGYSSGTVDFGGGPIPNVGSVDACVALLTAGGAHVFSHGYGSTQSDYGRNVVITPAGGVAFLAAFRGTIDFGGGPFAESDFNQDLALVTFDASGNHVWSTHWPGSFSGGSTVTSSALAVSGAGDLAVAGELNGSADFGGGMLTSTSLDAFLVRLTSGGAHVHSANFGAAGIDGAKGVAFDASGNTILSGTFSTGIDLGGGPIPALGLSDAFAAVHDDTGALVWGAGWGAPSTSRYLCDVAVGPGRDDFQLCGAPASGLDFGGGGLAGESFLARLDGGGGGTAAPRIGGGIALAATPNPCRDRTTLRFTIPDGRRARVTVYDVAGRLVATPADGLPPGEHAIAWRAPHAGVWWVRVATGAGSTATRVVRVR